MLLLHARFRRGEDVRPQLQYARARGANVIRVFARVPPENGSPEWADYRNPEHAPDFEPSLRAFFQLAADAGLRVEYVVETYADGADVQRGRLQQAFTIARDFWSVFIEAANEPNAQGIDVVSALQGVDTHGVLYATGCYDLEPSAGDPLVLDLPMGDYVTTHTDRGDGWPRKAKDGLELRDGWDARGDETKAPDQRTYWRGAHRPVILDEPIGIAETEQPGHRTATIADIAAYAGVGRLYSAGTTVHSDAGLQARVPDQTTEPVQCAAALAVLAVWQTIPGDVYALGRYTHDGFSELAVAWQVDVDGLRCYAAIVGHVQYVVPVEPRAGWTPQPIGGYAITTATPAVLVCQA
jgi:hypothetical protein